MLRRARDETRKTFVREPERIRDENRKSGLTKHTRLGCDRDAALRPLVGEAFAAGRAAYGYRRVHAELRRRGVRARQGA